MLSSGVVSLPLRQLNGTPRNFTLGVENRLATMVFEKFLAGERLPGPLVLYGPSGVGKTHFAEGLLAARRDPNRTILMSDGIEFARHYADALDTESLGDFRARYRAPDLLLLDHVAPLFDKAQAALECARLLDDRAHEERFTIVTLPRTPEHFSAECAPLASRLGGGLSIAVAPPGAATQREMLQAFAADRKLSFSAETIAAVLEHLAAHAPHFPVAGDFLGFLNMLETTAVVSRAAIDDEFVRSFLAQCESPKKTLDFGRILTFVARRCGTTPADLRGPSRRKSLVRARTAAAYLARFHLDLSFEAIGEKLGKRDHTTILHAVKNAETLLAGDSEFLELIESFAQEVRARVQTRLIFTETGAAQEDKSHV